MSDSNAVYVHANDIVGKPTGKLEIIVGDIANYSAYSKNNLAINDYAITYNAENGVLWLQGGSFTGVEQAVLDFIKNYSDEYTINKKFRKIIYTTGNGNMLGLTSSLLKQNTRLQR